MDKVTLVIGGLLCGGLIVLLWMYVTELRRREGLARPTTTVKRPRSQYPYACPCDFGIHPDCPYHGEKTPRVKPFSTCIYKSDTCPIPDCPIHNGAPK